jgi:PAS domain S-box-containing protein
LAKLKTDELAETIRLETAGEHDAAMKLVQSDGGKYFIDEIRAEIALRSETLRVQTATADQRMLEDMRYVKRWGLWTAVALLSCILLAATQLHALARERRQHEYQLAAQTSLLNTIVDEIPAMVAVWDAGGRYRLVNKAFEKWRSRRREAIIGKTIPEVVGAREHELSKPWFDRALHGESVSFEKSYETGAIRHVVANYSPLHLADGSVGEVVVTDSLDTKYGLDQQAVNAVRQWTFKPGIKDGKPVAVRIMIVARFSLT